ncbi:uncharacterized protein CMU_027890 [Cryptosporidium muris RN66]|uniref:Uncharacterized protein n=1 Tax=Cryptosporidium muris (strain RN66) TaxID=441375 RepID=B6ABM7_CRYMR|nr:uncharacterized protein CMU_027890 [Cryptosporidium muris RN66]EEA05779.1 hypothetical protein CMU_027890 [Cryptosporidium muris RN66]|eukprot:XP_002140128.1 hypothetical protein [Cryptosporidium muris RN66]
MKRYIINIISIISVSLIGILLAKEANKEENLVNKLKNGPIGALFLPNSKLQGPYNDFSADLKLATEDIKIEYDTAKKRISKFRNQLMGPVQHTLQTNLASKTQLMTRLAYVGKLLRTAYDHAYPDKAGKPIVLVQKTLADEYLYPPVDSKLAGCAASILGDMESDDEITLLSPTDLTDQTKLLEEMDEKDRHKYSSEMAKMYDEKASNLKEELSQAVDDWQSSQLLTSTKSV